MPASLHPVVVKHHRTLAATRQVNDPLGIALRGDLGVTLVKPLSLTSRESWVRDPVDGP